MARHRTGRDIVVIGGSAGGLPALLEMVRALPADLPASLFIAIHTSADNPGILPGILNRVSLLPASRAEDHQQIAAGRIYIAPPDHHLLVKRGYTRITRGPQENGFRPAVDPLFRTAALSYGPRVIGVVLSGGLDDGAWGLRVVKAEGGIALVQDPQDALIPSMPENAIANVRVDDVLKPRDLGLKILELTREQVIESEADVARRSNAPSDTAEAGTSGLPAKRNGTASNYVCPDCGGALWETHEGRQLRFSCHVGHSYSADGLGAAQVENVEEAMWTALRALEEYADLRRRMAGRAATHPHSLKRYIAQAQDAERRASLIRQVLTNEPPAVPGQLRSDESAAAQEQGNGDPFPPARATAGRMPAARRRPRKTATQPPGS